MDCYTSHPAFNHGQKFAKCLADYHLLCCSHVLACSPLHAADPALRLATTTSTANTGLMDFLLPRFTAVSGFEVHLIAVGTGKALRLGREGDVDVVLVHARQAEDKFVADGLWRRSR